MGQGRSVDFPFPGVVEIHQRGRSVQIYLKERSLCNNQGGERTLQASEALESKK